jgi:hypothetical protein
MYRPRNVPPEANNIPQFLDQELRNISEAMASPVFVLALATSHKEPAKLADGYVVLADGADWNPGSGAGYYGYRAGAWRFLG